MTRRRRTPLRQHRGHTPDRAYLRWIRTRGCVACSLGEISQRDRSGFWRWTGWDHIEAAHVGLRGIGQKCSDRETIPLCATCHRLGRDSAHRLQKKFWAHHGLDRDKLIAKLNALYDAERRAA